MAIPRPLISALDTDFNTAVRAADKDKAIAAFSALAGIAIGVASAQSGSLYAMLTKVTTVSFAQLNTDKNAVLSLIARNNF